MNYRMVAYIVGQIVRVEGLLLLLPMLVSIIYAEGTFLSFLLPALGSIAIGTAVTVKKPANTAIFAKEGFVSVGLSWIMLSLIGALPFVLNGDIPNYIDAFFETVSGFTTTGASILTQVEQLTRGSLFWRSFTHWVGGMGVLVFVLAVLPQTDTQSMKMMHVMRAEVPGPTVGKLVSKLSHTARITYGIYIVMTAILVILLIMGRMPIFDSLLNAFGTAGTGGFGIKSASIGYYESAYIDWVIGIFMLLFGVNFNIYYFVLIGHFSDALRNEELRWYLGIIAFSTAIIAVDINGIFGGALESTRYAFFQVSSIITTTGFATADFNTWPSLSKLVLMLLMFSGACAGSTGGGIKVSRIILLIKTGVREIRYMLHPRAVAAVRLDGKPADRDTVRGATSYMVVYFMIFTVSLLMIEIIEGCDLVTGFTSVATCINNVGPGLELVGPAASFAFLSAPSKLLLSFVMLAGRLEIFPLLLLFSPSTWRRY